MSKVLGFTVLADLDVKRKKLARQTITADLLSLRGRREGVRAIIAPVVDAKVVMYSDPCNRFEKGRRDHD